MIVIPMAGLSRRFSQAGYTKPKYMLEAHGRTLFDMSVMSFERYFDSLPFLFVARSDGETRAFLDHRCQALGIRQWQIALLDRPTRGQAETVELGLAATAVPDGTPITIFNIDTFRPKFTFPAEMEGAAGFLETFVGEGANWSFVKPFEEGSNGAAETSEKRRISQFCCTGLYHFARCVDFRRAFRMDSLRPLEALDAGELYVAPLYNRLIEEGLDIRFSVVPRADVIFCGIPAEYTDVLEQPSPY